MKNKRYSDYLVGFYFVLMLLSTCSIGNPISQKAPLEDGIIAYYLHTTKRCSTCLKIEKFAQEIILEAYQKELDSGRLIWKVVNIDQPENQHFTRDFELFTKSIVLVEIEKGKQKRWKNLDKIWELVWIEDKYKSYIRQEVNAFMGGE